MASLPTPALLKYLQTYNLLPHIHPSPLSSQHPSPPPIALLRLPTSNVAGPSNRNKTPWDDTNGQASTTKASVKNIFSNGVVTTSSMLYSTTSTLGLSGADVESPPVEDCIAMCDVDEVRSTLALLAQSHWNSMSSSFVNSNGHGYGSSVGRMNERDVIDDFMVALRAKGPWILLVCGMKHILTVIPVKTSLFVFRPSCPSLVVGFLRRKEM